MFIDMLLNIITNEAIIKVVILIKNSLILLLSLVNDVLDLKLIKENKLIKLTNAFNP